MDEAENATRLWPARDVLVKEIASIGETQLLDDDDMVMLMAESRDIRPFRRKWSLSGEEREARRKAEQLSALSYDIHKDHENYGFAPVVSPDDILSVAYRMATNYVEMLDVLDSLIHLHTLFHNGLHIGSSKIGEFPTELKEPVDIGLFPQHPHGFVGLLTLLYGYSKIRGGFTILRPLLLPRDRTRGMYDPVAQYEGQIDSRYRIGVTHRFSRRTGMLGALIFYADIASI